MKCATSERSDRLVIVVDDDPPSRDLLTEILSDAEYEVHPYPSGESALVALQSCMPAAILLDMNMPRMDGVELCRRIRARPQFAHTPIIFVSAIDTLSEQLKAFHAGANDFLVKPIDEGLLTGKVRACLTISELIEVTQARSPVRKALS